MPYTDIYSEKFKKKSKRGKIFNNDREKDVT